MPTLEGQAHHLCQRRREQPLALSPLVSSSTTLAFRRWQGRGVAWVAGCQNVATPAGLLVAKQMTGHSFELAKAIIHTTKLDSESNHHHHSESVTSN